MEKKQSTDWAALKVEYVTTSITLRDLADRHGIKAAGVMRRAAKEEWEAERKQESAKVSKAAIDESMPNRAKALADFNDEDLRVARGLRSMVIRQMTDAQGVMEPSQIRALAGAASEAQRIGRLALGAETESSVVTNKQLPASIDEFV